MTFESGDACPGGIQRRADVIFSCGPELAIAEASEPSICSYVLRATSPAACQVDRLPAIESKIAGFRASLQAASHEDAEL